MLKKILLWGLLTVVLLVGALVLVVALYPVPEPNEFAVAESSDIYYSDGTTSLAQVGDITRTSIPLTDVPLHTQQAVLAAEDRNFYEHGGFSPIGIGRAFWNNITSSGTQGGSTITQQYVKNAFLTQDQTIRRKVQELILAVKLEFTLSKDADPRGTTSTPSTSAAAPTASRPPARPTSGCPPASSTSHRARHWPASSSRRTATTRRRTPKACRSASTTSSTGWCEQGWLTPEEAAALQVPEFVPESASNKLGGQTGYLVEEARKELAELGFDDAQVSGGGLRIITTFDTQAQDAVVAGRGAVRAQERHGGPAHRHRLDRTADRVHPGDVRRRRTTSTNQLNNATQARAQAGSTFKPYALAAAFENGINLQSVWDGNSPRTISGYTLQNEGNRSYGNVIAAAGDANCRSTPPSWTSPTPWASPRSIGAAERAGLPPNTPGIEENLTFVLGTASPTPMEMAATYGTFATRGVLHEPTIIKQVESSDRGPAVRRERRRRGALRAGHHGHRQLRAAERGPKRVRRPRPGPRPPERRQDRHHR